MEMGTLQHALFHRPRLVSGISDISDWKLIDLKTFCPFHCYKNMDLQLFIVIIIGIVVGIVLARGVYRFFFIKKDHSICGSCPGCTIPKKQDATTESR